MTLPAAIDAQAIRRRAHERWLERGCPTGSPERDWLEAERELLAELRAGTRVVTSASAGASAVSDALQARRRRGPRAIVTRSGASPAAQLFVALVPAARRRP